MTLYNTFTTLAEAEVAQAYDFGKFIEGITDAAYLASTSRWAEVIELPDGKSGYVPCPASDAVYTTGEYTLDEAV
jgi:hypothetical protein